MANVLHVLACSRIASRMVRMAVTEREPGELSLGCAMVLMVLMAAVIVLAVVAMWYFAGG